MKNNSFLLLLSILSYFLPFTSTSAQVGGGTGDGNNANVNQPPIVIIKVGGKGTGNDLLSEAGIFYLDVLVNAINLVPDNQNNNIHYLPNDYPELWVEVSVNDQSSYHKVNHFNYSEPYSDISIYAKRFIIPFNLESLCIGNATTATFFVKLVTPVGDADFTAYPICQYINHVSEAFTCRIFYHPNLPDCPIEESICQDNIETYTTFELTVDLECGTNHPNPNHEGDHRLEHTSNSAQQSTLVISPNPFDDHLQAYWTGEVPDQIILMDIQGKIVQQWNFGEQTTSSNLSINTQDLAKGLYLLKVKYPEKSQTFKVIKS